jgi:putative phosphoesterase
MRVAVVGDTHMPRFGDRLPAALHGGLRDQAVDLVVHVGDFTGPEVPALFEALGPLEAVAGNNDPPALCARFGRRKVLPVGGVRLGLVHGDGRGGTTLDRSVAAFAGEDVDVICFGHSHRPLCERRDAVWLVNPGSPTDKRRQPRYSYAIIEIARGRARPRLVFFDRPPA